ncbi:MAG: glycosyltransferase family 2 protein [Verrucomicrobiae bacterium]|nr:glycosyltransferase family 2 protein [Verrucomicrobiae bacterium]
MPPFPSSDTIAVIPAMNEAAHIGRLVREVLQQGCQVWVIDDGSQDATALEAEKAGARVIRHPENRGKGMAIRTAIGEFLRTTASHIIFLDADGQHDPSHIPAFLDTVRKTGASIVLGNRMDNAAHMPAVRRLTNRFMSWVVSRLAGQRIPDSQCGYRLLSRDFAMAFQPTTSHFDLESEMLAQAGRQKRRIVFVPIQTIYAGEASHIHPIRDAFRFLRFLFRQWTRRRSKT